MLAGNDAYLRALELGIANYTALAERMKDDVERMVGSKVNLNTVVVAIKRLADTLEKQRQDKGAANPQSIAATAKAKMSLTDSIIDLDFGKEHDKELASMLEEFMGQESRRNLFQTDNHFTLLAEDADEIRKIADSAIERFNGRIKRGLSKITITISPDDEDSYSHRNYHYQLLWLIPNVLYSHQIPVHCSFFASNEMVIVLSDQDAARAYELIRRKIGD